MLSYKNPRGLNQQLQAQWPKHRTSAPLAKHKANRTLLQKTLFYPDV